MEKITSDKPEKKSLKSSSLSRIGNFIKEARLNRNESISELAKALKISAQQLEAIEEGHEDQLPEKVFVKAMVRRISEKLKLDTEFIMREFNNQTDEVSIEEIINKVNKVKETNKESSQNFQYMPLILIIISGMIGLLTSTIVLNIFSNSDNNSVKEELINRD